MTISVAIQEAISKELPNAVGEELKKFIQQAEYEKVRLANYEKENVELVDRNRVLSTQVKQLEDLQLRSDNLEKRERNLELTIAQIEKKEAVARSEDIFSLVGTIFKNSQVRRRVVGGKNMVVPNNSYTHRDNYDETITEEEE